MHHSAGKSPCDGKPLRFLEGFLRYCELGCQFLVRGRVVGQRGLFKVRDCNGKAAAKSLLLGLFI